MCITHLLTYLGVVVAANLENLASVSDLLDEHRLIIAQKPLEHAHVIENVPFSVYPAFLASIPQHPFWKNVFAEISNQYSVIDDTVVAIGSTMLTKLVNDFNTHRESHSKPIFIAPADMFCPKITSMEKIMQKCNQNQPPGSLGYHACKKLKINRYVRYDNFTISLAVNHGLSTPDHGLNIQVDKIITKNISKFSNMPQSTDSNSAPISLFSIKFDVNLFGVIAQGLPRSKFGIPFIHHFVWIDINVHVPLRYESYIKSWVKYHPENWHYKLWTPDDALNLIDAKFPQYSDLYRGMHDSIFKADFIRYCILAEYGGTS